MKKLLVSAVKSNRTQKQIDLLKNAYYENHTDICELEASDDGSGAESLAYCNGYEAALEFVFKTLGIEL